jgi:hypothetical protein
LIVTVMLLFVACSVDAAAPVKVAPEAFKRTAPDASKPIA